MSHPGSRRRTGLVSGVLSVAALALSGILAPAVAADGAAVVGSTGPDAAYKRIPAISRTTTGTADFTPRTGSTTGSTSYAFSTVLDGSPVRWNPCAPIRWTANTGRGPVGGLAVLQESVARVAALTGTTWQYVGPTTTAPVASYLPTRAQASYPPVLIGWGTASSSDLLAGQPSTVLGMTRTAWFGVQTPDGRKIAATRAAVIALDAADKLPLRGNSSWGAVALHELGHAMGLGHVSDRTQLMASVLPPLSDLQAGDRAGLARVGRGAGCVVVP